MTIGDDHLIRRAGQSRFRERVSGRITDQELTVRKRSTSRATIGDGKNRRTAIGCQIYIT